MIVYLFIYFFVNLGSFSFSLLLRDFTFGVPLNGESPSLPSFVDIFPFLPPYVWSSPLFYSSFCFSFLFFSFLISFPFHFSSFSLLFLVIFSPFLEPPHIRSNEAISSSFPQVSHVAINFSIIFFYFTIPLNDIMHSNGSL